MKTTSRNLLRRPWALFAAVALAALALPFAGCDDDEFDHEPPEGKGTLYVDNRTAEGMDVFIDGERVPGVGSGDNRFYDLDPGVYRVALQADDTDRSYSGDVDVLDGRRTIMDVSIDLDNFRRLDVFTYFK